MFTFILWFALFIILGLLGYQLVTFVITLISEIGDCFMGDNGGIIIWIIIIVGGLVMLLL